MYKPWHIAIIAITLGFFLAFPTCSFAATIYANYSTGNDTTGAGTSGNPYKTFHKAYTSASANDTINLTGTFDWSNSDETGDSSQTGYTVSKSLIITGQDAASTIIQASSTIYTANRRIFSISGSGTTVTLQNMTLRYGYMANTDNEPSAVNMGSGSILTMINTIVTQNANNGRFASGAIEVNGTGKFIMRNSTVSSNNGITAQQTVGGSWYGYTGGIEVYGTNTGNEITNTTFHDNGAQYNGAMYVSGSSVKLTLTNNTFIGNKGITSGTDVHSFGGAVVYAKNNIFAQKASGGASNLVTGGGGTFTDGGNNIVETQSSAGFTNGTNGNLVGTQSSLNISSSLATNSGTTTITTLALSSGSVAINAGTTTSHNSISVPLIDARQFIRDETPDIGSYEYGAVASDTTAPVISAIASTTATTTATITWTTNEAASTKVNFGPTSSYGTSTAETDTATRVTSHSISLTNLVSCTRYNFQVQSTDASSNTATSSDASFRTIGCTGSAAVSTTTVGTITTAAGGSISEGSLTLTVPVSFTTATSAAIFQANQLDSASFFASASAPSGKTRAGDTVFNLKAFSDATTTLSTFDSALTVSFTYETSDIADITESSLTIYRYDGSSWNALSGCSVDTGTNTATCSTTAFSDFALFGTETEDDSETTSQTTQSSSSETSVQARVNNLIMIGNIAAAQALMAQWPELFGQQPAPLTTNTTPIASTTSTTSTTTPLKKTAASVPLRNLGKGMSGEDVSALQAILIEAASGPSARELARVGATGYFGQYTKNALGEYQKTNGILPRSGYFGDITRKHMMSSNYSEL